MIDEIYSKGADTTILSSFQTALGTANGQAVFNKVIAKNPQFSTSTTRLQVFDAIAVEAQKQQIYVHLDNHISKAEWCCNTGDGRLSWTVRKLIVDRELTQDRKHLVR